MTATTEKPRHLRAHPLMHSRVYDVVVKNAAKADPRTYTGTSFKAARLVLVEGMSTHKAAARVGLNQSSVSRAVSRVLDAWEHAGTCPYCGGKMPEV